PSRRRTPRRGRWSGRRRARRAAWSSTSRRTRRTATARSSTTTCTRAASSGRGWRGGRRWSRARRRAAGGGIGRALPSPPSAHPRPFSMSSPAQPTRRRDVAVAAAVLIALHAALAWWYHVPALSIGHDDAVYVLLGRSLRALEYRDLYRVGTPPHAVYP